MPLKSCYQTQQSDCSPPIHPPWHNTLWPLAHMTLPCCCAPLLLAWPDSPLKGKGLLPRPRWPCYCPLSTGWWIRNQDGGFIQNLARQITPKRKDHSVFSHSLLSLHCCCPLDLLFDSYPRNKTAERACLWNTVLFYREHWVCASFLTVYLCLGWKRSLALREGRSSFSLHPSFIFRPA